MKKIILILIGLCICGRAFADWGNNVGTQPNKWTYINTQTTTVIKSIACFLGSIVVEGGTAGTITVYASGTTVAPVMANFSSTNAPNTYIFNANLASGCTIVTGAATQLTVNYL